MLFALVLFLIGEFLARCRDLVLRRDMHSLRSGRLRICLAGIAATETTADPADLQAGGETFEVAFLLVGKVDSKRFDFHDGDEAPAGHARWRQRKWNDRLEISAASNAALNSRNGP